jgi:cytochrome P450
MQLFDDLEDFGTFDDAVAGDVRDPYSDLAKMRRERAVQRLETSTMPHDESKPVFLVYRYDEVAEVFRNNEVFSSAIILAFFGEALGKHVMLGMDEPEHRRHRALVSAAFTQRALARYEQDLVERAANELIDRFAGRGHAELVREFTFPYPSQIIAGLLGLPREDYPQFQRWSISLLSIVVNRERAIAAAEALRQYFIPILEARRAEPRDDLISRLAQAEIDGEKLADEEIFSFLRLLLPAGVETTYRSMGNLLFALLSHPDQLEAVRADRSLIPQAIEEALRWEPPLLSMTRVAVRDTELGGERIPAGSAVMPLLGSANRDESRWADPDRFDIFRPAKSHISFGYGTHVCLGMHLARLETRVALDRALRRLAGLRLDPARPGSVHGLVFRKPTAVHVLWDRVST